MSPTAAIISGLIGLATLVFAIFGASWLNQRNIERLLDQMEKRFDERFKALEERISSSERSTNERISSLERRLEDRFNSLEQRVERIERQLEAIFKPILPK